MGLQNARKFGLEGIDVSSIPPYSTPATTRLSRAVAPVCVALRGSWEGNCIALTGIVKSSMTKTTFRATFQFRCVAVAQNNGLVTR